MSSTDRSTRESKDSPNKPTNVNESIYIEETCKRIEKNELDVLNARLDEQLNLVEFYKSRGDAYKKRISKLEKAHKDLIEGRENLATDYDNLNDTNKELKNQIVDLNTTQTLLKSSLNEKCNTIDKMKYENLDLNKFIEKLQHDWNESQLKHDKEIKELVDTLDKKDLKIEEINYKNEKNLNDLKEIHEIKITSLSNKIVELQKKYEKDAEYFDIEIAGLNSKIVDLNTQCTLKNNKISKIQIELSKQEKEMLVIEDDLNYTKSQLRDSLNKLNDKSHENIILNNDVTTKASEIDKLTTERSEMIEELDNLNATVNSKNNEIGLLRFRINDLEDRIKGKRNLFKNNIL